jgi:hypothetical protein
MNNTPRLSIEEDRRLFQKCTKRDNRNHLGYLKCHIWQLFFSIKIHISCVVINCINSGRKSFDLIPQTFKQIHFISEKLSFYFLELGAFSSVASLARFSIDSGLCYNKISSIMSAYCRVCFTIKAEKTFPGLLLKTRKIY